MILERFKLFVFNQLLILMNNKNLITTIISSHNIAEVRYVSETNHHSLHALCNFNVGDVITNFKAGSIHSSASYLTIQTGIDEHITLKPDFLQYTNHSCVPNVFFDTGLMQLICIKSITVGDEMCFFYPSTEWEMAQPFACHCGHHNCLHAISGAKALSPENLTKYKLTNFIKNQLKENNPYF
jgi:hypothetical protein